MAREKCKVGYRWSDYSQQCTPNLEAISRDKRAGNKKCVLKKETKEGFYCTNYPEDLFYVIRWLQDGGYHLYPNRDGILPHGYKTKAIAEASASMSGGKVVTGKQARKYPIPRRW